jgi:hypothetical protein
VKIRILQQTISQADTQLTWAGGWRAPEREQAEAQQRVALQQAPALPAPEWAQLRMDAYTTVRE